MCPDAGREPGRRGWTTRLALGTLGGRSFQFILSEANGLRHKRSARSAHLSRRFTRASLPLLLSSFFLLRDAVRHPPVTIVVPLQRHPFRVASRSSRSNSPHDSQNVRRIRHPAGHSTRHLPSEIYLPLGSCDGPYEVPIATVRAEPRFEEVGEARTRLNGTADLKMSFAKPGNYLLQVHGKHPMGYVPSANT
jgi:hypothetical protein